MGAWLVVAMSAPFVHLAGKQPWPVVLAVAAVALLLSWTVLYLPTNRLQKYKAYCALEYIFLILAAIPVVGWSADAWPTGRDFPVVPLTLLALAVASAYQGAKGASKAVSVLFWLIVVLYGILLAFGGRNIQVSYLYPQWEQPELVLAFAFLIPCAAQFVPMEKGKIVHLYMPVLAVLLAALTLFAQGNLSSQVAGQVQWPFYTAGESVSIFGVAKRLEPLISVAATVGYFALYSLLAGAAGNLAEGCARDRGKAGVLAFGIAVGAGAVLTMEVPFWVLVPGAVLLWILLPLAGICIPEKKSEKSENNA